MLFRYQVDWPASAARLGNSVLSMRPDPSSSDSSGNSSSMTKTTRFGAPTSTVAALGPPVITAARGGRGEDEQDAEDQRCHREEVQERPGRHGAHQEVGARAAQHERDDDHHRGSQVELVAQHLDGEHREERAGERRVHPAPGPGQDETDDDLDGPERERRADDDEQRQPDELERGGPAGDEERGVVPEDIEGGCGDRDAREREQLHERHRFARPRPEPR